MFRTATCGELRLTDANKTVTLAGWVQKVRNLGSMVFIDLRDRYGITQITVDEHAADAVRETAGRLGREYVIQVTGTVTERSAKNSKIPTGEIEIVAADMQILNTSEVPPFTIEEQSDGGDDLRMRYRYLDLRRAPLQRAMMLRHRLAQEVRNYLDAQGFMEIETPYLIKSTPEGARDFVVPSRMNPGEFYALPQSPQTFKQLLMVSGYDLAGRPAAGIYPGGLRNGVRGARGRAHGVRRDDADDVRQDAGGEVCGGAVPAHDVARGDGKIWVGQTGYPVWDDVQ